MEDSAHSYTEAIHLISAIQSHGCLLVFHPANLTVIQASANAHEFISAGVFSQILGKHARAILGGEGGEKFGLALENFVKSNKACIAITVQLNEHPWKISCIRSEGGIICEVERCNDTATYELIADTRAASAHLSESQSVQELCERAVKEFSSIIGYDRVMVYQFNEDGHGTVLAEELSLTDKESYLGMQFPAGDIPKQARELFMRTKVRTIVNARASGVAIVPATNPLTGKPLDLTLSALRQPSACHLQYLNNMGVAGSVTQVITKGGALWGLLCAHHYSVKYVDPTVRNAVAMLGDWLSVLLTVRSGAEIDAFDRKAQCVLAQMYKCMLQSTGSTAFPDGLCAHEPNVMDMIECCGTSVIASLQNVRQIGDTPPIQHILPLLGWLTSQTEQERVWGTDNLSVALPAGLEAPGGGSYHGLLAASVSHQADGFVLWWRKEAVLPVIWAGSPTSQDLVADMSILCPRTSFKKFTEVVRGRSKRWSTQDYVAGRGIVRLVADVMVAVAGDLQERGDILARMNQQLEASNGELEKVSKELLRLVETVPAPIFALDLGGNVLEWNPMCTRVTGYTLEEIKGESFVNKIVGHEFRVVNRLQTATALHKPQSNRNRLS